MYEQSLLKQSDCHLTLSQATGGYPEPKSGKVVPAANSTYIGYRLIPDHTGNHPPTHFFRVSRLKTSTFSADLACDSKPRHEDTQYSRD